MLLIDAKKIRYRRLERKLQNSVWRLTFRDGAGEYQLNYSVESNRASRNNQQTRNQRYPRFGATSVVKDLTLIGWSDGKKTDEIPAYFRAHNFVLKSIKREKFQHVNIRDMKRAALWMAVQGEPSIANVRKRLWFSKQHPFMIMQKVGDHGDLLEVASEGSLSLVSAESQRSLVHAVLRLVAFMSVFHQKTGRASMDIKPENLIGTIRDNKVLSLTQVDLDSSCGDMVLTTYNYMAKTDFSSFKRTQMHSDPSLMPKSSDFRTLSISLAAFLDGIDDRFVQLDFRKKFFNRSLRVWHDSCDFKVIPSAKNEPINRLLSLLRTIKEGDDLSARIASELGASEGRVFTESVATFQQRYAEVFYPNAASVNAAVSIGCFSRAAPRDEIEAHVVVNGSTNRVQRAY